MFDVVNHVQHLDPDVNMRTLAQRTAVVVQILTHRWR